MASVTHVAAPTNRGAHRVPSELASDMRCSTRAQRNFIAHESRGDRFHRCRARDLHDHKKSQLECGRLPRKNFSRNGKFFRESERILAATLLAQEFFIRSALTMPRATALVLVAAERATGRIA